MDRPYQTGLPSYHKKTSVRLMKVNTLNQFWRPCVVVVMVYLVLSVLHKNDVTTRWRRAAQNGRDLELRMITWKKQFELDFVAPAEEYGSCVPHSPSTEELAYLLNDGNRNPNEETEKEICHVKNDSTVVSCNLKCDSYTVVHYDEEKQKVSSNITSNYKDVEDMLSTYTTSVTHFPVVVKCTLNNSYHQQVVFTKVPAVQSAELLDGEVGLNGCSSRLALTVIYIDTLSRFDAFRILPQTASLLQRRYGDDMALYDFHLLQSVAKRKGDAVESLVNFSGRFPKGAPGGFYHDGRPAAPLNALLEAQGIQGSWFRDTCDVDNFSNSPSQRELSDYHTLCKLFIRSCSSETDTAECLRRLRPSARTAVLRLSVLRRSRIVPTFSLIELPSPLKYSYTERQQFDSVFSRVIGKQSNSCGLFFILSGHGDFFSPSYSVPYGNIAASNPFFALATTDRVLDSLNIDQKALEANTRRLITIHDVSETIKDILCSLNATGKSQRREVVARICEKQPTKGSSLRLVAGSERTCRSMSVPDPHLCVCDGESSAFRNDTINVVYAEFVIGEMNRRLQEQVAKGYSRSHNRRNPFGACEKIRGYKFSKVQILKQNASYFVTFDVWVLPSHTSETPPAVMSEQYKVTLSQTHAQQNKLIVSFPKLIDIDRVTYNWFSDECRDELVQSDYCLCDKRRDRTLQQFMTFRPKDMLKVIQGRAFGVSPYILDLHRGCLILVIKDYNQSMTFEAANVCHDRTYKLRFQLATRNMVSSSGLALETTTLRSLRYHFIGFARQASYALPNKQIVYKPLIGVDRGCVSNERCKQGGRKP